MKKGYTSTSIKNAIAILVASILTTTVLPIATIFATAADSNEAGYKNQIISGRSQSDDKKELGERAQMKFFGDYGQAGMTEDNFTVSVEKSVTDLDSKTGERMPENNFEITLQVKTTANIEKIRVSPDAAVVIAIDLSGSMNSSTTFQTVAQYTTPINPATGEFLPESTDYSGYYVYNNNFYGNYNGYWTQHTRNDLDWNDWSTTVRLNIPYAPTRLESAKKAANEFLDSFASDAAEATRMVSIVTFNGVGANYDGDDQYRGYSKVELNWTDVSENGNLNEAKGIINGLTASLGTFTQGGLMLARNLYLPANAPLDAGDNVIDNRYVILLTDGNPTHMLGSINDGGADGESYVITNDISNESLTPLEGNLFYGAETESYGYYFSSVSAARNASASVAAQIKSGDFNGSYPARLYTIGFGISSTGFANSFGGNGSFTGDEWLQNTIASATTMHYTANDISGLRFAFEKISETITKIANAWTVTDQIAMHVDFNSDNVISDSINSAFFNDNTLTWNIKDSIPVSAERRDEDTIVYTYELKYKVTLDNLAGYQALSAISTSDTTTLTYVVDNRKADEYDDNDFVTVEFAVPAVCGYDAPLAFTKVDDSGNILTNAFGFTLTHSADCNCRQADSFEQLERTVSSETGEVDFGNIPSGHEYVLTESINPEPALYETAQPSLIKVSYGVITADAIINGQFENKALSLEVTTHDLSDSTTNTDSSISSSDDNATIDSSEKTSTDYDSDNGCNDSTPNYEDTKSDETIPTDCDDENTISETKTDNVCDELADANDVIQNERDNVTFDDGIVIADEVYNDDIVVSMATFTLPVETANSEIPEATVTYTEALSATTLTATASNITPYKVLRSTTSATSAENTDVHGTGISSAETLHTEITEITVPADEHQAAGLTEAAEAAEVAEEAEAAEVDVAEAAEAEVEAEAAEEEDSAEIVENAIPQSTMPQTGINDTINLWIFGLCLSLLGLVTMLCVISQAKKR